MLISLSTGSIYKWNYDLDNLIKICKNNFKIDGIELMLTDKKSLKNFTLHNDNLDWIKNLKHVTLHAPRKIVDNPVDDLDIKNQLNMIENIYNRVGAKAVIFHITNLPELKLLNQFNFKFIIENTTKKGGVNLSKFTEIVKEYESDICLDVSHAFTWSNIESQKYALKFKNNIFQIHLSVSRGGHEHLPISNLGIDFDKSIKFLKNINKPIIVEADYNDKDIEFLNNDLNFIFDYFKK